MDKKRVAIIGSGCSGLGALWALRRTNHDVHLYEAEDRLGGHVYTLPFKYEGKTCNVDTGFIVCNPVTYPNFMPFLNQLDIEIMGCDMSFGVSRDDGAFEWAGINPATVFTQKRNLFNPSHWRMVFDIIRFNQFSIDILNEDNESEQNPVTANGIQSPNAPQKPRGHETVGCYLEREGYSASFRDDYLIPMTAAIWGTGSEKTTLDFPAITLVRFMWNHQLLNTVSHRAQWYSIKGGSKLYVESLMRVIARGKRTEVHLGTPVQSVSSGSNGKVTLQLPGGSTETFDHVIMATHGDQALRLLKSPTLTEKSILSNFRTVANRAYLHSDLSLMPKRRDAWAAWNYMTATIQPGSQKLPEKAPPADGSLANGTLANGTLANGTLANGTLANGTLANGTSNGMLNGMLPAAALGSNQASSKPISIDRVCLTFDMNLLQHIPRSVFGPVLVTLNPIVYPDPRSVQAVIDYRHPLYNPGMIAAQARLPEIQNTRGISFCGAWTKYGFHEDGFSSGIKVAMEHLEGSVDWKFRDATFIRGRRPELGPRQKTTRFVIGWIQFFIMLLDVFVGLLRGGLGVIAGGKGKKIP